MLPDVVNALLLVFVLSAANSGKCAALRSRSRVLTNSADIYVASRTLFGLAKDGQAPRIFAWTTTNGVPMYGVALSSAFILLGYMNIAKSSSTVFGYFVSLVTVFGTLNWVSLLVSYIAMRRGIAKQGIPLSDLPYRGPLQPYGAYFALFMTFLIIVFNGKNRSTLFRQLLISVLGFSAFIATFDLTKFITSYIGVLVYVVNFVAWKIFTRCKRVSPDEMDLTSDRR